VQAVERGGGVRGGLSVEHAGGDKRREELKRVADVLARRLGDRAAHRPAAAIERATALGTAPSVHDAAALGHGPAHDGAARGEAAVGPGAAVGEQAAGEGGGGHALMSPTRAFPASCASGDVVPPKDDLPLMWRE